MAATQEEQPLWIHRRLLNTPSVFRFAVDAGIRKTYPPEQLHFTQATVRDAVTWGDLQLDERELVIPSGPKEVQIFAYIVKAIVFDHETIRRRHAFLLERFPTMDHPVMRPHLSLYKGGRMPRATYEGELVFGPEIATRFDAENVQGIKHVKAADHV